MNQPEYREGDYSRYVTMNSPPFGMPIEAYASQTSQEFGEMNIGTGSGYRCAFDADIPLAARSTNVDRLALPDSGRTWMEDVNVFNPSTNFDHFQSHPGGQWDVYATNVGRPPGVIHNGLAGTQMDSHDQANPQYGIPAKSSPSLATSTSTTPPDALLPRKFPCSACKKPHPRRDRAEACENSHSGANPLACLGRCGKPQCSVVFTSRPSMMRHLRPEGERNRQCDTCGKEILRQNFARHRRTCPKCEGSSGSTTEMGRV